MEEQLKKGDLKQGVVEERIDKSTVYAFLLYLNIDQTE
jgi:hypothetical protein